MDKSPKAVAVVDGDHELAGGQTPQFIELIVCHTFFEGSHESCSTSNAAFPSLLNCGNGTLLMAHRVGSQKNTADGTQYLWRSDDHGATWRRIPLTFRQPDDRNLREYRTAALSDIGNGRIAMLLTWIDHFNFDEAICNTETGGLMPLNIGWRESTDNGLTWSELREISVAPISQPCSNGTLVRLPGGRLIAGFETYKAWDDASPWSARSMLAWSDDDGATWQTPVQVAGDATHDKFYWDHHLLSLGNDELVDVMWADEASKPGVSSICTTRSTDGGATWETPRSTGISGQYAELIHMDGNEFLLTHVQRSGNPSIHIRRGRHDKGVWTFSDDYVLYSQQHDDLLAAKEGEFVDYLSTMATWSFGWPSMIRLDGGTLLCAYYIGRGHQASIKLARLNYRPATL
jgi:Neuraminidase (sialidase)